MGERLGIRTVRDLLFHLPRRYDDLREMQTIGELRSVPDGTVVSANVSVRALVTEQTFRRRIQRTTAYLGDDTGEAEATWFGRRFIEKRLHEGDRIVVSGKLKRRGFTIVFDNPEFQRDEDQSLLHVGRIVPVYRLTAGITSRTLRTAIRAGLDRYGPYPEYLPGDLLEHEGLLGIERAVEAVHYPEAFEERDAALRRIAFDELLALQIGMVQRRRQRGGEVARPVRLEAGTERTVREAIRAALEAQVGRPIELTDDQASAMTAVAADLGQGRPMLRLLQGDVGSGKTAVAAYALATAALAGRQGALLAPTDLLARQHAVTLTRLLDGLGLPPVLLTGSLRPDERAAALEAIASGTGRIVVGTHALIQEAVAFADLALAIIDEQHRFGVEQRGALEAKAADGRPHVLLMTATPIPRTLGQVLYADLDVSDLRSMPGGRTPIRTGIRQSDERSMAGAWQRVREEAAAGHRTFVVVPLIDEGDDEEDSALAASAEAERLARDLAPLRVGLVHGRMRPAERDTAMAAFRDGLLDVLVGTTVVEVGVDVPEATMMIVEGADRFGLAQLHQLRGRVGRGEASSFCVLVSDAEEGSVGLARLRAVRDTLDGFALAEEDFRLRREGDVLGYAQSGLPRLRVASLQEPDHRELATRARRQAESLVDPAGELVVMPGLRRELTSGWLAGAAAGEAASGA